MRVLLMSRWEYQMPDMLESFLNLEGAGIEI